jgi:hypothetical protein
VSENRLLRRIFGPKRDEVTGGWINLHNEGLHNLHSSSNVIRMINSRRIKCGRHVTRMGEDKCIQSFGGKVRRKETTRKIYT